MTEDNNIRTFVFLKPDCTIRRAVSAKVLKSFLENNFKITAFKEIKVNEQLAKIHYKEHEGKPFYSWLCKMLQLYPVVAMVIEDSPQKIREFIGETFCHKADENTLRGKYGIWGGVNSIHASDSHETAQRELEIWEKFAGLTTNKNIAQIEINNYIRKWDGEVLTNLKEVRKICNQIKSNPENTKFLKDKLRELLWHDCNKDKNINEKLFDQFLDIIIENCLL